jgi:ABC-type amino acid transport substrate-binding protein
MKENKKFGIQLNVFYGKEFNDKLKEPSYSKYFAETSNVENNISLLANDRIIGFFEDKISLAYLIKNSLDFEGCVLHSFNEFPKDPVYFAVNKNMSELIYDKLRASYKELEKNGTLESIRQKYQ